MVAAPPRHLLRFGLLGLPLAIAGCGHAGSDAPTLSVTCDGKLVLAGASSVVVTSSVDGPASMSFPDPVNAGQTGTLPVPLGRPCTIAPVAPGAPKSGS